MRVLTGLMACTLVAIAVANPSLGRAEDYPTHPVRIIVGFGAGASADVPARLLAQKFSQALGRQFIVENKPGAGSNLAAEYVAHSPNDGYTLFLGGSPQTSYAAMTVNPTFDVVKDFTPIIRVASVPLMLVANPSLGVDTLQQLIALAKTKPNQIFFASSGVGSAAHIAGEVLNMQAGIKLVHVPYPGSGQALADVVSGRVQLWFTAASAAIQQVRDGKLKAIAVTTARRASIAPDVPTVAEAGLRGYDFGIWFGLFAPAGTPAPIVDKLTHIAADALKSPDVTEPLRKIGFEPIGGTADDLARYVDAEVKKATAVAIAANIRK